jgi:hypothetical protein
MIQIIDVYNITLVGENQAPLPPILGENKIQSPPELGDLGGLFLPIRINDIKPPCPQFWGRIKFKVPQNWGI